MALRTASLILVASATSLKEILWDSLFAFKYFPGDSIVSRSLGSPSDSPYNLLKRFSKIIINGFHPFVNRAYPLLTDVSLLFRGIRNALFLHNFLFLVYLSQLRGDGKIYSLCQSRILFSKGIDFLFFAPYDLL